MTTRLRFLERSVALAAPPEEVYAFHLDTRNVAAISPPGAQVTIDAGEFPLQRGSQVRLTMRQRPFPWRQRWHVRVDDLEPGRRMVDVALAGPFPCWRHEHVFDPASGGTIMTDRVTYALPGGRWGSVLGGAPVALGLAVMFRVRHRRTARLLAGRPA